MSGCFLSNPTSFYQSLRTSWPQGYNEDFTASGWYSYIALNHWLHTQYPGTVTLILVAHNVNHLNKTSLLNLCPPRTSTFLLLRNGHYTCWRYHEPSTHWYEIDSISYGQTGRIKLITDADWFHITGSIFTTVSLDAHRTGHTGYPLPDTERLNVPPPCTLTFFDLASVLRNTNTPLSSDTRPTSPCPPDQELDTTLPLHRPKPMAPSTKSDPVEPAHPQLTVATLNVRGYHSTLSYLRATEITMKPPLIWIFTETRLTVKTSRAHNTTYCLPTHTQFHSPTSNPHTGGVTIAIAHTLYNLAYVHHSDLPPYLSGHLCHVSLTYPDKTILHLLGVYISPASTSLNHSKCQQICQQNIVTHAKAHNHSVLIGGDFNGTLYPSDRAHPLPPTPRDTMLRHFLQVTGLCDLSHAPNSPRAYTYESANGLCKSNVDHVFYTAPTPPLVPHCTTIRRLCHSPTDHNILYVSIPYQSLGVLPLPTPPARQPTTKIATPISPKTKVLLRRALQEKFDLWSQQHASLLKTCFDTQVKPFIDSFNSVDSPGTCRRPLRQIHGQSAKDWINHMGTLISDTLVQAMDTANHICPLSRSNPRGLSYRPRLVQRRRKQLMQHKRALLKEIASIRPTAHNLSSRISSSRLLRRLNSEIQSIDRKHHTHNKQIFLRQQQLHFDTNQKQGNKQLTGKFKPQNPLEFTVVRKQNGMVTTDPHDISNYITNYYSLKMQPPSPKAEILNYDSCARDCPWEDSKQPDYYYISTNVVDNHRIRLHHLINDYVEFQHCLQHLPHSKAPGPDLVINEVLQAMPDSFHDTLFYLFQIMWAAATTPDCWKVSFTKLINKHKGNFLDIENYRRLGLECTVYKLWTSFITRALNKYAEDNSILSKGQLGFRRKQKTSKQIELLCSLLEHAKFFHKDIYLLLLDCTEAFDTVDHVKLTRIMFKLGFPTDAIDVVSDLYTNATTMIQTPHAICTRIPVNRGTLQGDSLSPLLFIIYIEPLLRWLFCGQRGYTCQTHANDVITISDISWADDINILTETVQHLFIQARKITVFCDWANLKVSHAKTSVTGALHKTSPQHPYHTQQLKRRLHNHVVIQGCPIAYRSPHDKFKFLGIHMNMKLDWSHHYNQVYEDTKDSVIHLLRSHGTPYQKRRVVDACLRERLSYSFTPMPFNHIQLKKLDNLLAQVYKQSYGLPKSCSTALAHQDTSLGGLGCTSLHVLYTTVAVQSLTRALSDPGDLGMLTHTLLQHQLQLYIHQPKHRHLLCVSALRLRQLKSINDAGIDISNQAASINYSFPSEVPTLNSLIHNFITTSINIQYPSKLTRAVRAICDLPLVNLDVLFEEAGICT